VSHVHAALTALAFVLSSLIGMVHEATTRHVRCAEHGELVHAAAATTAASATPPTTQAPDLHSIVRDFEAATLHGHEHCLLTSTTRESRIELRAPAVVTDRIAISDAAEAVPRLAAAPHGGLYRTAPKTSPPA
jgi:hypothetical protein